MPSMYKRTQYSQLVSGIPQSQVPERVQADKFPPQITPPQSNWQKAAAYSVAALAPFLFFVQIAVTPPAPVQLNSPLVTYKTTTLYQSLAEPVFVPPSVTVDKWHPEIQKPPKDVQRSQYLYPFVAAPPAIIPQVTVINGSNNTIIYPLQFQYQALTKPLPVPVRVDMWTGQKPDSIADVKRTQYLYPFFSIDAKQLTLPERITPDKWIGNHPDFILDVKRQQYLYPYLAQTQVLIENITLDKWFMPTQQPRLEIARIQYLYPASHTFIPQAQNNCFALQFDGLQNYLDLGTMSSFGSNLNNGFYAKFDIKTTSTADGRFGTKNATNEQIIIGFNEDFNLATSSGNMAISVSDNSGNKVQAGTFSPPGFNDGAIHTIEIGIGAGQNFFSTFKIDGATISLNYQSQGTPALYVNFTQSFTIGASNENGTLTHFIACIVGNIKLGTSSSTLYGNYALSEGSGTTTADSSGKGNTGTLIGSPLPQWVQGFCNNFWNENVSIDRFNGQKPDILFDLKRQQYLYPSIFFTQITSATITLDRWIGQKPDIVFDIKRTQYLYPYFSIDTKQLTIGERITPDKWLGNRPEKLFDIPHTQYLYPSVAFVQIPQEVITLDKWIGSKPDVFFDLKRIQYLYPSFTIDGKSLTAHETITLDKWFTPTQQPLRVLPVTVHLQQSSTIPVVPPSSTVVAIIQPGNVTITYPRTFQYQSITSPLSVEKITVDKWFKATEQPRMDISRLQHLYPSFAIDAKQLTLPERATPDKWLFHQPDFVPDIKRQQYLYPSYVSSFVIPQPTIIQVITNTIVYPVSFQYQAVARPVSVPPEIITVDKWFVPTQQPRLDITRNQYLYPSFSIDTKQLTLGERITLDKWIGQKPEKIFDVQRTQYLYPNTFFTAPIVEKITVDKWFKNTEQPLFDIKRNQYLYPSFNIDTKQLTLGERITLDKWIGNKPDFLFDVKRTQFTYPYFSFHSTPLISPLFADKWHPEIQRPPKDVVRTQYLYPSFSIDTTVLMQHEVINSDKWTGQYPNILFDVKRQQYAYPYLFYYSLPQPDTSEVYIDKYNYQVSAPVWDSRRQQYLYPSSFYHPLPQPDTSSVYIDKYDYQISIPVQDVKRQQYLYPGFFFNFNIEKVTVDKWFRLTEQPRLDIARIQYLYPSFVIDVKQLTLHERITPDKWIGQKPDFVLGVERRQYVYQTFFKPVVNPGETVLYDKWSFLQSIPRFDVKRQQYLYPSFFISPRGLLGYFLIPPPTGGGVSERRATPTAGIITERVGSPTGGLASERRNIPTGGVAGERRGVPTGGSISEVLQPPTNPKSLY